MFSEAFCSAGKKMIQLISKVKAFLALPSAFCLFCALCPPSSFFLSQCSLLAAGETAYSLNLHWLLGTVYLICCRSLIDKELEKDNN